MSSLGCSDSTGNGAAGGKGGGQPVVSDVSWSGSESGSRKCNSAKIVLTGNIIGQKDFSLLPSSPAVVDVLGEISFADGTYGARDSSDRRRSDSPGRARA